MAEAVAAIVLTAALAWPLANMLIERAARNRFSGPPASVSILPFDIGAGAQIRSRSRRLPGGQHAEESTRAVDMAGVFAGRRATNGRDDADEGCGSVWRHACRSPARSRATRRR